MRLWKHTTATPEGKYLVTRRDGTIPEWPNFVIGARDPAAPAALRAYALAAEVLGFDPLFVQDVRQMADRWDEYRADHGAGDPDAPPHRMDDPATIEKMRLGKGVVIPEPAKAAPYEISNDGMGTSGSRGLDDGAGLAANPESENAGVTDGQGGEG